MNPAGDLLSEFDRMFRHAWRGVQSEGPGDGAREFSVYDAGNAWQLRAELPGFGKEDLEITLEEDILKVGANRTEDGRGFANTFSRSLRVPDEVDRTGIAASLEHGILEITLPKSEPVEPETRRITIN